jgi:hypothetical protein
MLPKINRIKDITVFEHGVRAAIRGVLGGEQFKKDCARCPQAVWINVFFDGTRNNFRLDELFEYTNKEAKQSNIAKLAFFAWPQQTTKLFAENTERASYRIYESSATVISKVGVPALFIQGCGERGAFRFEG